MSAPELTHLSYSSISAFLECPRRWKFHYVDKLPTAGTPALVFGTAVHATLARYFAAPEAELPDVWREEWSRAVDESGIEWGSDLPEQMVNDGVRLFGNEATRGVLGKLRPAQDENGPVVERRIEVRVPGVPVPVIGYLDFLGDDGVLRDFKTASRAWSDGQLREQSQPLVYLAAANQMKLPHVAGQFVHVVLVKGRTNQVQELPSQHSFGEVLWMFSVIRKVWEAIEAGWFAPNPKACFAWNRRCEYWSLCRGRG